MAQIADILGLAAGEAEPMVAVVRCNGTCANRPRTNQYDGAKSCAIAASLYGGETGCSYGCLGCGDCVAACQFDAIHMNPETGLPEVDEAEMYRLWRLCEGLPEGDHRNPSARKEVTPRVCLLCE